MHGITNNQIFGCIAGAWKVYQSTTARFANISLQSGSSSVHAFAGSNWAREGSTRNSTRGSVMC